MESRFLALLILLPFIAIFIYAAWHEHRRYRNEGRSTYGLTYDPESNTTYVGTIADGEESYDPEDFVPENTESEDDPDPDDTGQTDDQDHPDKEQDKRT